MKKIISFFGIFFYIVGAIGGFGYACYLHEYFIAACLVVLTLMAWPQCKKFYETLNS